MASKIPRNHMLTFDVYEVWVEIEKKSIPVWNVKEGANTTSCYIASEENKDVEIHWRSLREDHYRTHAGIDVFWDGEHLGGFTLKKDYIGEDNLGSISLDDKLQFTKLARTDDKAKATRKVAGFAELGSIRLNLQLVSLREIKPKGRISSLPAPSINVNNDPLLESQKERQVHCLGLGRELPLEESVLQRDLPKQYLWTPLDRPTHDFTFHYMPMAWLQAEGYAPHPREERRKRRHERRGSKEISHSKEKRPKNRARRRKEREVVRVKQEPIKVPLDWLGKVIDFTDDHDAAIVKEEEVLAFL